MKSISFARVAGGCPNCGGAHTGAFGFGQVQMDTPVMVDQATTPDVAVMSSAMSRVRRATPNISVSLDVNDLPPMLAGRVRNALLNGQQLGSQPTVKALIEEIPSQFGRAKARLSAAYKAQSFALITIFSPEQMQLETNAIANALGDLTSIGGSYWTSTYDRSIFSLQRVGLDVARLLTSGTSEEISRYVQQMYIAINDLSNLTTTTFLPLIAARARVMGSLQSTVMYLTRYADRLQSIASALR